MADVRCAECGLAAGQGCEAANAASLPQATTWAESELPRCTGAGVLRAVINRLVGADGDAGFDFEAEIAFLRGTGPDPVLSLPVVREAIDASGRWARACADLDARGADVDGLLRIAALAMGDLAESRAAEVQAPGPTRRCDSRCSALWLDEDTTYRCTNDDTCTGPHRWGDR